MDLTTLATSFLAVFACGLLVSGGRVSPHSQSDIKFLASSDPHLKKQARLLAATCDCNKQGAWRPILKHPVFSDHHLYHGHGHGHGHGHDIVDKLKAHGFDVGDTRGHPPYNRDPSAKNHNHLIHLHLIPHIYVPIMHPVSYQVHEEPQEHNDVGGGSSEESHPSTPATSQEDTGTTSSEDTSLQNGHDHGHEQDHGHGHGQSGHGGGKDNGQFYTIPPEAYEIHEDHIQHYHHIFDPTNSIEDFDIPKDKNHHLVLGHRGRNVRHQYEVHEEPSKDNFINTGQFNNIPAGSNTAPQLYQPIQPLLYINKRPYLRIPVPALPKTRHRYMRKLMSRQDIEKLKTMKPPSLGQKQTWLVPPRPILQPSPIVKLPTTLKLSSPVPPLRPYTIAHPQKIVYLVNVRKKSDRRKK